MNLSPMIAAAVLILDGGLVTEDPDTADPRPFKQKSDDAFGWIPYSLVTYGVVPGFELFQCFDDKADPKCPVGLKEFPDELVKQLRSGDAEGRAAALRYLRILAGLVRNAAWMRSRDEGDRSFRLALGDYTLPVRSSLEAAVKVAKGEDRLNAAAALLALTPDHRPAINALVAEFQSPAADRRPPTEGV
ncbi:MAG: hypothetical protein JWO38_7585 [Gemmataceae bacterium]|nr:hypothetical protein [Gemmataceae bacterium]